MDGGREIAIPQISSDWAHCVTEVKNPKESVCVRERRKSHKLDFIDVTAICVVLSIYDKYVCLQHLMNVVFPRCKPSNCT